MTPALTMGGGGSCSLATSRRSGLDTIAYKKMFDTLSKFSSDNMAVKAQEKRNSYLYFTPADWLLRKL